MATVSRSLPELSPVQRRGLLLTLVGLLLFGSFPVGRLAETYGLIDSGFDYFILISPYGACVFVWGVFALRTGKRRPLTPTRAFWIPILVASLFVGTSLMLGGRYYYGYQISLLGGPGMDLRVLWELSVTLGFTGSSTYAVLGAAIKVRRMRAILAALALILFVIWAMFQRPYPGQPVIALTIPGIFPFVIGYRATSTPDNVTPIGTIITELSDTEWRGVKLAIVGLLLFAAFPVLRLAGILEWGSGGLWVLLLSTYGACILIWGIFVVRTETGRPLTPKRALLIPLLVTAMAIATDLLTRGRLIEWWVDSRFQGPLHNLNVFGSRFQQLEHIGASIYVVLGAAARSEQWPWVLVSVGLILGVSWMLELIPYGSLMFVLVAIFGIVPAIIGYRAAPRLDE